MVALLHCLLQPKHDKKINGINLFFDFFKKVKLYSEGTIKKLTEWIYFSIFQDKFSYTIKIRYK